MKPFILLIFVCGGILFPARPCLAAKKVALLTSLDLEEITANHTPEQREEYRLACEGFSSYFEMLESDVRKAFPATEFEVEVSHGVDQHGLSRVLSSPLYSAVFWVSHAGFSRWRVPGVKNHGIFDRRGFDLSPVFQGVSPSLEFLGVISCKGKEVLDLLYEKHGKPRARVHAFAVPVDVKKALLNSLEEAKTCLETEVSRDEDDALAILSSDWISVQVTRDCRVSRNEDQREVFFPAVRVMSSSGTLLGTFPTCRSGETLTQEFHLSRAEKSWNVSISTGERFSDSPLEYDLGEFRIAPIEEGAWQVFRSPRTGRPQGIFSRVFVFQRLFEVQGST